VNEKLIAPQHIPGGRRRNGAADSPGCAAGKTRTRRHRCRARLRGPHITAVGSFRNVTVDGLDYREMNCSMPAIISGIPGHMIENVVLRTSVWSRVRFAARVEALLADAPSLRAAIEPLLKARNTMRRHKALLDRRCRPRTTKSRLAIRRPSAVRCPGRYGRQWLGRCFANTRTRAPGQVQSRLS
jgi:hypothetical protein